MNMMQMISQFPRFMQQNKGQNPDAILQNMINSGKINQNQLNEAQRMANEIMPQFEQFKNMFNFK